MIRGMRLRNLLVAKYLLLTVAILGVLTPLFGQGIALKKRGSDEFRNDVITLGFKSELLDREVKYRVVLPGRYKLEWPNRYPVVFLLHGLTGHFDNWTDRTKLAEYSTLYKFIIVTPEGGDGWYTDSATTANDKYESYIVRELIPEIDKKFRTLPDRDHRAIAGLSMGGYGALKFGLKYPELFSLAGSFSGALAVTATLPTTRDAGFVKSVNAIFGPADSETRMTNDIFKIVSEMPDASKKNLPFLYIDCGTEDFLFQSNRNFIALLLEEKIPHEYRQRPGGHSWTYWDAQVQEFLELSDKHFKK